MFGGRIGIPEIILALFILAIPFAIRNWYRWLRRMLLILLAIGIANSQVTVVQSPVPKFRSFLPSGFPNVGGCVYTFASGTSTPQPTYTDFTGAFQNLNPVILDANGEAQIFITSAVYRFQVWSFGQGVIGSNCGGGTQLYQIDGIRDTGLGGAIGNLAAVVTVLTATNNPTITTVNPAGANQNYFIPDPGASGNFVINPSGTSANALDCTLPGITCKRTASFYFSGAQCNASTPAPGWDTFGGITAPQALCVPSVSNVQKGMLGMPSAYTPIQKNTGTNNASTTVTTTYPAATIGGNGDMLVLSVVFNGTTTITGCTDTTNAYTQAKHIANGALSLDIWVFHNAVTKAAGTTLTCTFAGAATSSLIWHEYIAPSATSTDVSASNSGTSATATTGTTATLAQATELAFAAAGNINNVSEVVTTSGFTDHTFLASNATAVDDEAGVITQALTAQSASFTLGSSQAWAAAIVTFKATNGGIASAFQTINLPQFWNSAAAVNSTLKWTVGAAPVGTSNAVLGATLNCAADGTTDDGVFNGETSSTVTVLTTGPNIPTSTALNGLSSAGCATGNLMHLRVDRFRYNASDTYEGFIQLVGAQLQIGITQ